MKGHTYIMARYPVTPVDVQKACAWAAQQGQEGRTAISFATEEDVTLITASEPAGPTPTTGA